MKLFWANNTKAIFTSINWNLLCWWNPFFASLLPNFFVLAGFFSRQIMFVFVFQAPLPFLLAIVVFLGLVFLRKKKGMAKAQLPHRRCRRRCSRQRRRRCERNRSGWIRFVQFVRLPNRRRFIADFFLNWNSAMNIFFIFRFVRFCFKFGALLENWDLRKEHLPLKIQAKQGRMVPCIYISS